MSNKPICIHLMSQSVIVSLPSNRPCVPESETYEESPLRSVVSHTWYRVLLSRVHRTILHVSDLFQHFQLQTEIFWFHCLLDKKKVVKMMSIYSDKFRSPESSTKEQTDYSINIRYEAVLEKFNLYQFTHGYTERIGLRSKLIFYW